MVDRAKPEFVDRFVGEIISANIETSQNVEISQLQYHLQLKPDNVELLKSSKTGFFHEWIRISEKTEDGKIVEGSVLDRYVAEIELLIPETKKLKTHKEVFDSVVGKRFEFARKKLGKSFSGHDAKEYWIPISLKK